MTQSFGKVSAKLEVHMWAFLLALTAYGGNLTITESADSIGKTNIVYGGSAALTYATTTVGSTTRLQIGGWSRYGLTDKLDAHGKLYVNVYDPLLIGLSGGFKYELVGNRNRSGLQMSVAGIAGAPSFRFNPLQLQVPFTIGYRTSPDFALYVRPFGQLELYSGNMGSRVLVGGAAGGEISGVVPLNIELEVVPMQVATLFTLSVGVNVGI